MGTQFPSPKRGHGHPVFGPCLLWPNGWMDHNATWYDVKPRPRQHCLGCRRSCTPRGTPPSHQKTGPRLFWLNSWMDQDATWYEGRPRSRQHCYMGPSFPSQKAHSPPPPQFSARIYSGQTVAHLSYCCVAYLFYSLNSNQ